MMCIEQEILFGVGGVCVFVMFGLKLMVWYVNEGYVVFLIFECICSMMGNGLVYLVVFEVVVVNVVFMMYMLVLVGYDYFFEDMICYYFFGWCNELGIFSEQLMVFGVELGKIDFNMMLLVLCGLCYYNGVLCIYGEVLVDICCYLWLQIEFYENLMDYVINGVYLFIFFVFEWFEIFECYFGIGWCEW